MLQESLLDVFHIVLHVKALEISVDDMTLKSPISGTVDLIGYEVGETVNGLEDIIRILGSESGWRRRRNVNGLILC